MKEKKLEPLIKSTLQSKEVDIKDTMKFDRRTGIQDQKEEKVREEKAQAKALSQQQKEVEEKRKVTMKTQKMSLDVLLKLDILDPFLRSAEDIEHDGKISINDKVDILISSYLNAKLPTHQLEGFKAIYNTYTGQ